MRLRSIIASKRFRFSYRLDYKDFFQMTIEGQCDVVYAKIEDVKQWKVNSDENDLTRKNFFFLIFQEERNDDEMTLVSKTIDFSKCTKRPDVFYTFRMHDECRDCEDHTNKRYKDTNAYEPSTVWDFVYFFSF